MRKHFNIYAACLCAILLGPADAQGADPAGRPNSAAVAPDAEMRAAAGPRSILIDDTRESATIDFVTASLLHLGYTVMEAEAVRPVQIDGREALQFDLKGKWKNGLNVGGLLTALVHDEDLKLALFLAPDLHYFDASAPEITTIMASIDLPD